MTRSLLLKLNAGIFLFAVCVFLPGCLSVKAPDEINIGSSRPGRRPIDTRRVPPTRTHEEARQKLAQAYDRIHYLEGEVRSLKKDLDDLEDDLEDMEEERDEWEEKYDRLEDKYDD